MEKTGDYSFLKPDERKLLIESTVDYLDCRLLEGLKPLIRITTTSAVPKKQGKTAIAPRTITVAPYNLELPVKGYNENDGEEYADSISVVRAVLVNVEKVFPKRQIILRPREFHNIVCAVVNSINGIVSYDPPEPDTTELEDLLVAQHSKNESICEEICTSVMPPMLDEYFKTNEQWEQRSLFLKIDSHVRRCDKSIRENRLLTTLWNLPITGWHDTLGLEKDWLDDDKDYNRGIHYSVYSEDDDASVDSTLFEEENDEEERDLNFSEAERFFLQELPQYVASNRDLIPHTYLAHAHESTNGEGLSKAFLRKRVLYMYAENIQPKKPGNKKSQNKREDHIEKLWWEIVRIGQQLGLNG
ncbi:hypothetical protein KBB89_00065 [Candidatus Gracilibacteria bacterium]|nr:hypothetical protein [Candidatus Gracilibacteria bacterium]